MDGKNDEIERLGAATLGVEVGERVGVEVGAGVGEAVGAVGTAVGEVVGVVGKEVGEVVGAVGKEVGEAVGAVGKEVGYEVGAGEGDEIGEAVGAVGKAVGVGVGDAVRITYEREATPKPLLFGAVTTVILALAAQAAFTTPLVRVAVVQVNCIWPAATACAYATPPVTVTTT